MEVDIDVGQLVQDIGSLKTGQSNIEKEFSRFGNLFQAQQELFNRLLTSGLPQCDVHKATDIAQDGRMDRIQSQINTLRGNGALKSEETVDRTSFSLSKKTGLAIRNMRAGDVVSVVLGIGMVIMMVSMFRMMTKTSEVATQAAIEVKQSRAHFQRDFVQEKTSKPEGN